MDYGPVPSRLYDIIRSDNQYTATTYTDNGSSKIPIEKPLIETDLDRLSKTDIDLLDIAIKENITKSFARLTSETHGYAYEHTALNSPMDIFNMAKGLQRAYREDRFDEDKLEYIKNNSIPLYSFITRSAVQVERVDPIEMVKKVIDFMKKNDDRIPREKSKSNDDQDEISLRIFLKHRKEQWDDLPESLKKAFKAYKPLYEFMTISYK